MTNPSLHKDILVALGSVVVVASTVETALGTVILWLTGHPKPDNVLPLVGGMDIKVKTKLIRILSAHNFQEKETKHIGKLCDKIDSSFDKRNTLIHGLVAPTDNPRMLQLQITKFKLSGNFPQRIFYTPEEIFSIAKEMQESFLALEDKINSLQVKQH